MEFLEKNIYNFDNPRKKEGGQEGSERKKIYYSPSSSAEVPARNNINLLKKEKESIESEIKRIEQEIELGTKSPYNPDVSEKIRNLKRDLDWIKYCIEKEMEK